MTHNTRVWFNRGFSLAPIAGLLRAADPTLDVFVSVSPESAHYNGPTDTWIDGGETNPGDTEAYLQWVREIIADHKIDIFIPTRRRALIAGATLPCRVELPASIPTLAVLDDKYLFANELAGEDYHLPTYLARGADDLERILGDWDNAHGALGPCVKPRQGVNGLGYWRLADVSPMAHLNDPERRRIRPEQYLLAVRNQEKRGPIDDIVVMPYLPGPEISFDILAHRGAMLKYAARIKLGKGRQHIVSRHPLEGIVTSIVARFDLHGVVNAQFRCAEDGRWLLLEINARPAGGVVYAEQVGCGLIADWAGLLTGRLKPNGVTQSETDTEVAFSTVVTPIAA
jgi:hypothetical protein